MNNYEKKLFNFISLQTGKIKNFEANKSQKIKIFHTKKCMIL